jgi:lipopolysaccharide heptosyltransferase II
MSGLQIPNPRERALVGAVDLATRPLGWIRRQPASRTIRRVLLMRLERIGDLLMVLDAIAEARAAWPSAEVDLVVGSWNLPLARLIPGINKVHVADVPWLARDDHGDSWTALVAKARVWRALGYDLVVNFEPDVRSNFLAWLSGAPHRHGYWTGGGGSFLTDTSAYVPSSHVGVNARNLIFRAAGLTGPVASHAAITPRLNLPPEAMAKASSILGNVGRPLVGVHVSGGRESKQWHLDRFADVAARMTAERGATIVLTGSESDRPLVEHVASRLQNRRLLNLAGALDLVTLAAVLSRLDLLITGDTGPMHLASAMQTPLVALFGPSDPRRYGPTSRRQHVLRVDLWCSPCGQVRLPPSRCRGHVPDCMDGIQVDRVVEAALDLLDQPAADR